jgi:hypothetical protein
VAGSRQQSGAALTFQRPQKPTGESGCRAVGVPGRAENESAATAESAGWRAQWLVAGPPRRRVWLMGPTALATKWACRS